MNDGTIDKLDQDFTHSHVADNETQAPCVVCVEMKGCLFSPSAGLHIQSVSRALQRALALAEGPVEISTMRCDEATKTLKPLVVIFMSSAVNPCLLSLNDRGRSKVVCLISFPLMWLCAFVVHSDSVFLAPTFSCRGSGTNKRLCLKLASSHCCDSEGTALALSN